MRRWTSSHGPSASRAASSSASRTPSDGTATHPSCARRTWRGPTCTSCWPTWSIAGGRPPSARRVEVLEGCGRALGTYHARSVPGPSDTEARTQALHDLERAARAMAVPRGPIERVADVLVVARGFGDFGPHQFRLGGPDGLYLLDPPLAETFEPVHRDLARFLFGLARTLGRDAGDRRRQRRAEPDLRSAFLRGYRQTGPTDTLGPARTMAGAALRGRGRRRHGAQAAPQPRARLGRAIRVGVDGFPHRDPNDGPARLECTLRVWLAIRSPVSGRLRSRRPRRRPRARRTAGSAPRRPRSGPRSPGPCPTTGAA